MNMSKISYYTEKGLKELRQKLDHLKDIERPLASKAIGEARDKGDLSENAEYDAAKEAQGMLEMEISKLEETLSNARIIDESKLDSSIILIHSTVTLFKANGTRDASSSSPRNPSSGRIRHISQRDNRTHGGHLQTRISPAHCHLLD